VYLVQHVNQILIMKNFLCPVSNRLFAASILAAAMWAAPLAHAQTVATLTDIGSSSPSPGSSDQYQLNSSQTSLTSYTQPPGLNYYFDNASPPGETFTTGSSTTGYTLNSVAVWTDGNSGSIPSGGQEYQLYIYSVSGSTAALAAYYDSANNFTFTDGDWLQWSGLSTVLLPNTQYAYTFHRVTAGWEALGYTNGDPYTGGQICEIPIGGGAIIFPTNTVYPVTSGYNAAFDVGLTPVPGSTPLYLMIYQQPANASVLSGLSASFNVNAVGVGNEALTYKWYTCSDLSYDNPTLVQSSTNSTYTIASTVSASFTNYYVVVSDGNSHSVTSSVATLTQLSYPFGTTAFYSPDAWVNDPSASNPGFTITGANTASPSYVETADIDYSQNMWGYSPLGTKITLTTPGTSAILTSQFTLAGDVVGSANIQFRLGLVYKGSSATDTGWAGTAIAMPNTGGTGLYLENIPNTSQFETGGSATIPGLSGTTFTSGSDAGTFALTLSVTYLGATSNLVCWTMQGLSGDAFVFAGRYTNTSATTECGFSFDTVGFLKASGVFTANSTANAVDFNNVLVIVGNFSDGAWTATGGGLWSGTGNWANGAVANGTGFIADFSRVDLAANSTVTLDASRNIAGLVFGATSGSTYNWILTNSGGNTLSLNNNGLVTVPTIAVTNNMATLNLPVISTNGLAKTGAGTLVLGGNNTIVGPLDLNGGELSFSSISNLPFSSSSGISSITFGGGALQWGGNNNTLDISSSALGLSISFAGNAGFDTGANNVTFANGFGDGGVGGFAKLGTGRLTLDGSVSYTGTTSISNGVLALGSSGSISSSTKIVVLSGATFDISALDGSGGLNLTANSFLSGAGTVIGDITDNSGVTIGAGYAATKAAGTLTINGNLSLVNGSTLTFGLANVTTPGQGINDLIAVSGTLDIANPITIDVTYIVNGTPAASGDYTLFTYGTLTAGSMANITAPAGFTLVNTGSAIELAIIHTPQNLTWVGDGTNNYWDTDTTEDWLDSGSAAYFFSGDSVTFNNSGSDVPYINIDQDVNPASVTVNASAQTYDFAGSGAITSGNLKVTSGTLILENNNTYSGPTVIGSSGLLQVGGPTEGGASGTLGTGAVTNNGALVFDLAVDYTLNTNIYGTGSINNIGTANSVTLSNNVVAGSMNVSNSGAVTILFGSNSFTEPTIVSAGSLRPGNAFALGTGSTVVSNGGQIYINYNVNITNPLTLAGTGVSSDGALRKGGNGTTILGSVITLAGDTQFQVDGGSILNITNTITGTVTNLYLGADAGGSGNIISPLNLGSATLTVQDAGTWSIAPNNNYTGGTVLNGSAATAMLVITSPSALGPISEFNAAYVTMNEGILGVSNNVTFNDGLSGFTINGTCGFDVSSGMTLTIANPITGSGTLTKSDSGTLVLSGSNPFSGTLNVDSDNNVNNDGVLEITSSSAIANVTGPIAIQNHAGGRSTFELNGASGPITVTQDFNPVNGHSPNVPVILSTAGNNTLSGNFTFGENSLFLIECDSDLLTLGSSDTTLTNTWSDPQTLTFQGNGNISVAGVITDGATVSASVAQLGNGTLTLEAVNTYSGSTTVTGGTLAGTGTIGGPVNIEAGGTLAPGSTSAPLGALTINNTLDLAGNTLVSVSGPHSSSRVLGLTGVTYGGTLTVTNVGGALAEGNTFQIFPVETPFTQNFTSISGNPGASLGYSFNPATGVLSVVSAINTNPPTIGYTYNASSGVLTLSWTTNSGWILQSNSVSLANTNDWFTVAGSSNVTTLSITNNRSSPAVFYRMVYP
jgi:autotransporter-associated beta strand protein